MRITKVSPVIATPKTKRKTKEQPSEQPKHQYLSETDPAVFIHSNKAHRTVSEAFKDAEYACSVHTFKSDFDRTMEYLGWGVMWAMTLGALYLLATAFNNLVS